MNKVDLYISIETQIMTSKKVLLTTALFALLLIGAACGLTGCVGEGGGTNSSAGGDVAKGLPPDPGEAGKATLAGIDSDNDGVRDDVQRYIALTYPDSEKTRAALTQFAKNMQQAVLEANDKKASLRNINEQGRVLGCLIFIVGDIHVASQILKNLESEVMNTVERRTAYDLFNDQLDGEVFDELADASESTCDSNVKKSVD